MNEETTGLVQVPSGLLGDRPKRAYLMVLASGEEAAAGRMYRLEREVTVIGRSADCDIVVADHGVSRVHAKFRRAGNAYWVEDLDSRNGTMVNGKRITRAELVSSDHIQIGSTTALLFTVQDDLEESFQRNLYEAATRDGLTGVLNRRSLMEVLTAELAYSKRHQVPASVVMIDVDNFKLVNDTYGHQAGDRTLVGVTQALSSAIRGEDRLGRYGGEEFLLVLRETTQQEAFACAERCRRRVETSEIHLKDATLKVTISLGISTLGPGSADTTEALIGEADKRLYEAKARGRNCTVGAAGPQFAGPTPKSNRERRLQTRIEADLPCRVTVAGATVAARVRDLSFAGAQLVGERRVAVGTPLVIDVDAHAGPLSLAARVMWADEEVDRMRCGVMFESLKDSDRVALSNTLEELLSGKGFGLREHPRVFRRVHLAVENSQQATVLMQDISRGGLGIVTEESARIGEHLTFELSLEKLGRASLAMTGTVVHVTPVEGGQFKVGLKFDALDTAAQQAVDEALRWLIASDT